MNSFVEVVVLVEGQTEQRFVKKLLWPYLAERQVYMTSIILNKPGEKGGDVRFARAKLDIRNHLKQRADTFLTLLVDYYGIGTDWPGYENSKSKISHTDKSNEITQSTALAVKRMLPELQIEKRFIPYVSMHEIEALYFSDPEILANALGTTKESVKSILDEFGDPEMINDNYETAPSRRIAKLFPRFKKTSTGLSIAEEIGIARMRSRCKLFDNWLTQLESLGNN
ncbi:MAG: DUF4276 family protein [Acidobacteria bacterium]|nr:DUF4276 family protein [Acidobacteriota bacterium]